MQQNRQRGKKTIRGTKRQQLKNAIRWFCDLRRSENIANRIPFSKEETILRRFTNWQLTQWNRAGSPDDMTSIRKFAEMSK